LIIDPFFEVSQVVGRLGNDEFVAHGNSGPPPGGAKFFAQHVFRDAAQVRLDRRVAPKRMPVPPGPQKNCLHQFFQLVISMHAVAPV
jgi:hypothetical protein